MKKKKEGIFCTVCPKNIFLTFVNEYTFKYTYFYISKNITSYTFLLIFKIVKILQCIPNMNKEEQLVILYKIGKNRLQNFEHDWHFEIGETLLECYK